MAWRRHVPLLAEEGKLVTRKRRWGFEKVWEAVASAYRSALSATQDAASAKQVLFPIFALQRPGV
jgi:hypothetical protein